MNTELLHVLLDSATSLLQGSELTLLDGHDSRRDVGLAEFRLEGVPSDVLLNMHSLESIPPSSGSPPETVGSIRHFITVLSASD